MDTQEAIDTRKSKAAKHNPWDSMSGKAQASQVRFMGARPIKWTLDLGLVNTISEDGYLYTYAGGPLEGAPLAAPRKRADGKVDGRTKGNRKCGKCGGSGHNARTCGIKRQGLSALPEALRKPIIPLADREPPKAVTAVETPKAACEPSKASEAPPVPPKRMADRPVHPAIARALAKVPGQKTCGKCGGKGHNARTCGGPTKATKTVASKPTKVKPAGKVSRAMAPSGGGVGKTGRLNTCGKCGGKGHNARSCKG